MTVSPVYSPISSPIHRNESDSGCSETAKKICNFLTSCEGILCASVLLLGAGVAMIWGAKTLLIVTGTVLLIALRVFCTPSNFDSDSPRARTYQPISPRTTNTYQQPTYQPQIVRTVSPRDQSFQSFAQRFIAESTSQSTQFYEVEESTFEDLSDSQIEQLSKNFLANMMRKFNFDNIATGYDNYGKPNYKMNPDSKFMETALPILINKIKEDKDQNSIELTLALQEIFETIKNEHGQAIVSKILENAYVEGRLDSKSGLEVKDLILDLTLKVVNDEYNLEVEALFPYEGKYYPIRIWGATFDETACEQRVEGNLAWLNDRRSQWKDGKVHERRQAPTISTAPVQTRRVLGNLSEAQVDQLTRNYLSNIMELFGFDDISTGMYSPYEMNPDSTFMKVVLPIIKENFLQNRRQFILDLHEIFQKIETEYDESTVLAVYKRASVDGRLDHKRGAEVGDLLLEFNLKIEGDKYTLEVEPLYPYEEKYYPIRTWGLTFNEAECERFIRRKLIWLDKPSAWQGGMSFERPTANFRAPPGGPTISRGVICN